jgi:hypothetical protein
LCKTKPTKDDGINSPQASIPRLPHVLGVLGHLPNCQRHLNRERYKRHTYHIGKQAASEALVEYCHILSLF